MYILVLESVNLFEDSKINGKKQLQDSSPLREQAQNI